MSRDLCIIFLSIVSVITISLTGCTGVSRNEIYAAQQKLDGLPYLWGVECVSPEKRDWQGGKLEQPFTVPKHDRLIMTHESVFDDYCGYYPRINDLCFSADGKYIFSGSGGSYYDGIFRWTVDSVKADKVWNPDIYWTWSSYSIAPAAKCNYFLTTQASWAAMVNIDNYDTKVKWSPNSGEVKYFYAQHEKDVCDIKYSPLGKCAATASVDTTIRLWDMEYGGMLKELRGHTAQVTAIDYTPDGKFLFSVGLDATMRKWNTASGKCIDVLDDHKGEIWAVRVSPTGDVVISAGVDGCKIWNVKTCQLIGSFDENSEIADIDFSPNGSFALTACTDGRVQLWNTKTYQTIYTIKLDEAVYNVAFSPDGAEAVSDGAWGLVLHWNLRGIDGYHTNIELAEFQKIPEFYSLYSADKHEQADKLVQTINSGVIPQVQIDRMHFFADSIWHYRIAHKQIAKLLDKNKLKQATLFYKQAKDRLSLHHLLYQNKYINKKRVQELKLTGYGEYDKIIMYNGKFAELKYPDGSAIIWDIANKKKLFSYEFDSVRQVIINNDKSRALVFTNQDNMHMQMFDLINGEMLWDVHNNFFHKPLNSGKTFFAKFSRDGKFFITAGYNWIWSDARVWISDTGKQLHTLKGHHCLAYADISPDNNYMITGSGGCGIVATWDMKTGDYLSLYKTSSDTYVEFSKDSKDITLCSYNNVVKRELETGKRILSTQGPGGVYSPFIYSVVKNNERYSYTLGNKCFSLYDTKADKWVWFYHIYYIDRDYWDFKIKSYIEGQNAIFVSGEDDKKDYIIDLSGLIEDAG